MRMNKLAVGKSFRELRCARLITCQKPNACACPLAKF